MSFFYIGSGQILDVNELKQKLEDAKADTIRIKLMCNLARANEGVDSLSVFQYGYEALRLSKKLRYSYGTALSYKTIADGYLSYFDIENSKNYYFNAQEEVEHLLKKDSTKVYLQLWAKINFNLGVLYGYQGDNEQEIAYVEKTIPIARQIKDTLFLAIANTNLGIKYMNFAQFNKAYTYFEKSGPQYEALNNPDDIIFDRLSFSLCLYEMDSLSTMKTTLDKVKFYLDKVPKSIYNYKYYSHLGLYLSGVKRYEEAIEMYDKSYELLQNNKIRSEYASLFIKYAETYEQLGNLKMSKKYMMDFLQESLKSGNDVSRAKAYYRLARYESKIKNYKKAHHYLNQYIHLLDSLDIQETSNRIQQLEFQYQSEKKEKEILALTNEKNIVAFNLEKKRSEGYLMIIAIITLVFVLLVGYQIYRDKSRESRLADRKHAEEMVALKHEQQAKIFSAMIEGQERERKRLAIDLHDGLGGRLSAISLKLSKLDKDNLKTYPKQELSNVQNDIRESLSELRGIARNLMPETLIKYGLEAALRDYCTNMNSNESQVTLQFYGDDKKIAIHNQVTMYRIVQELINNAIKHAKASEVLVQYIHENEKIDIIVEDNGVGFNASSIKDKKGMGLDNLKTRVDYLEGFFEIQSKIDEGTTVTVQINA
ncbi:tetratricopeptide repeat-containing sensor histidine kinase [Aquimarina algiphila]|uniref:tetratricopeptide repeat-containing sensor histidine kinase n=1 Tax=Aquimarina algiphila TaxID=2047982 RepID=UPI00232DB0C6|nr:ATP-binding protein [Aquimarina algiphila]